MEEVMPGSSLKGEVGICQGVNRKGILSRAINRSKSMGGRGMDTGGMRTAWSLHCWRIKNKAGTSLVAQWLGLQAPNAGGPGSIPSQGSQLGVCMPQMKDPACYHEDPAQPNN